MPYFHHLELSGTCFEFAFDKKEAVVNKFLAIENSQ
jgi:hypothetical protein